MSEGDKIRNYILMGLEPHLQEKYYNRYWNKIELCTNYELDAFIRDYISVVTRSIPSMKKIYSTFKLYVEDNDIETESLLEDLYAYAKRYEILIKGKNPRYRSINPCIERLNRLETTVTRPFFLEVLRLNEGEDSEKIISDRELNEIFLFTESYLFRRNICNLPTNALNKIFLTLNNEIKRLDGTFENYLEKFKYILLTKTENGRFPDDKEFVEALSEKAIYLMNVKNKIYILERFENVKTLEDKDIYRHYDDENYSIEHIMPQTITPKWQEDLGTNHEEIHETWVNRLANLTLVGKSYNSKYSNRPFKEKRDIENGFAQSGLRLNSWIAQQEKWTLEELEKRNNLLMQQALQIWKMPVTEYAPEEKPFDHYTLGDEVNFRGREIIKFEYKNTIQTVDSWISMLEEVVKILHENDNSILSVLANINDPKDESFTYFVRNNPSTFKAAIKIDENIYIDRNTGTSTKISMLRRLFKAYNENPDDLVFYLKDRKAEDPETISSLEDTRRRYWTMALPIIKEAQGETGPFVNVNPTKGAWVNGFFSVQGFSIICVANTDQARVEMCLMKSDKQKNKSAYDFLLANCKMKLNI